MNTIVINDRFRLASVLKELPPYLLYSSFDLKAKTSCLIKITPYTEFLEATFKRLYDKLSRANHITKIIEFSSDAIEGKRYFYLQPKLKYVSLEQIFENMGRDFKPHTILTLGYHALKALEEIHQFNIIHGRIKPQTIYLSSNEIKGATTVFAIEDMKVFIDNKNKGSMENRASRFASTGELLGLKICPKDDLEALIYVLLHFASKGEIFSYQNLDKVSGDDPTLINFKRKEIAELVSNKLDAVLVDMYFYIVGLNRDQTPSYYFWMKKIQKVLGPNKDVLFPVTQQNEVFLEDHDVDLKMVSIYQTKSRFMESLSSVWNNP